MYPDCFVEMSLLAMMRYAGVQELTRRRPSAKRCATTGRVPRLHYGHKRLSANFSGSVSSALTS